MIDRSKRLGFGCAKLFRITSSKQRQRILGAAYDCGIRSFDVARMYGLGQAESELRKFLKTRPGDIQVTTKFGIPLGRSSLIRQLSQTVGRQVLRWFPHLRRQATAQSRKLYQPKNFSVTFAEESLKQSLHELGIEQIECYLLHEPTAQDELTDALWTWLQEKRDAGCFKTFGVSGQFKEVFYAPHLTHYDWPVKQFNYDIFSTPEMRPTPNDGAAIVTFSAISGALPLAAAAIDRDPRIALQLTERFGKHPLEADELPAILLRHNLETFQNSRVIFSTSKVDRLSGIVDRVENIPWQTDTASWLRSIFAKAQA